MAQGGGHTWGAKEQSPHLCSTTSMGARLKWGSQGPGTMRGESWDKSGMLLGGSSKLSTRQTFPSENHVMMAAAASSCGDLPPRTKQRLGGLSKRGCGYQLGCRLAGFENSPNHGGPRCSGLHPTHSSSPGSLPPAWTVPAPRSLALLSWELSGFQGLGLGLPIHSFMYPTIHSANQPRYPSVP